MRVALVSLDQRWHDKDANFSRCADFVRQARAHGCALVVFPEMTLTGYSLEAGAISEAEASSPTLARFAALASETGLGILFGVCLVHADDQRPRNQLCCAQPDKGISAVYAKIHPFTFVGEERVFAAGNRLGIVSVGSVNIGLSVCYDLRFPEIYGAMAHHCDAAVVIANWPNKRVNHWRTLLVARAIENQFYVLGVNRIGVDGNGLVYEESSMVVDPSGTVLRPLFAETEIAIYDLDPGLSKLVREQFPTVRDRRPGAYRELGELT